MHIDVGSETLQTFAEAAGELPSRPHVSTLHRWRLRGVRGVKLETCVIGGRRFISKEAIRRFAEATTAAADRQPAAAPTPPRRRRAIARAVAKLSKDGI
jgi:hypothetical protein